MAAKVTSCVDPADNQDVVHGIKNGRRSKSQVADAKELPKEIEEGITKFDPNSLKHAETVEKNSLPSPEVISQEKTLKNIEDFDKNKLKHAETEEKNPLPNKETIEQEKRLSKS